MAGKGRARKTKKRTAPPRRTEVVRWIANAATKVKTTVVSLPWWADVLSVVLFFVFLYQIQYSLVPVIQPDSAISSSWTDLPVTARNSGEFFDFRDAEFFCRVTEQRFEGDKAKTGYTAYRIKGLVEWRLTNPPQTIHAGDTVSFPCNIAQNSVLTLDGEQKPTTLIHMSIRTVYSVNLGLFRWHRESQSQVFTWTKVSGGYQWLPGATLAGPK